MSDGDRGSLVDRSRSSRLWDVGGGDLLAAVTVSGDGTERLWIVSESQLGVDGTDCGDADQPHERLGPIPAVLRDRIWPPILCGRKTSAGRPCRSRVQTPGEACMHHQGQDLPATQPDLWDRAGGDG